MNVPIACTLNLARRSERERRIAELSARSLRSREPVADGVRLVFAPDPVTEHEVRALVADEAQCCQFLRFRLNRMSNALVLEVTAPEEAQAMLADLFS